MAASKGIMVCATRQHVGKTSVSMALIECLRNGLKKKIGYMKPVGQMWVEASDARGSPVKVDKDVLLAREHFQLQDSDLNDMSPIIIERGKTKRFLNLDESEKRRHDEEMRDVMCEAYARLSASYGGLVVEGTGHCGVGSIVGWSNARVAAALGLKVVLIANGGIGSTFDELALNKVMCNEVNVDVAGVIVNRVRRDKVEQTREYLEKSFAHFGWNAPILGVVPDGKMLDRPSVLNLATLFDAENEVMGGEEALHRTFDKFEVVTSSVERMTDKVYRNMEICAKEGREYRTAFITHRSRTDIILGLLAIAHRHGNVPGAAVEGSFKGAVIMTGDGRFDSMSPHLGPFIEQSSLPVIASNLSTAKTVKAIEGFTPKLNARDTARVSSVIDLYSPHIDIGPILGEYSAK